MLKLVCDRCPTEYVGELTTPSAGSPPLELPNHWIRVGDCYLCPGCASELNLLKGEGVRKRPPIARRK